LNQYANSFNILKTKLSMNKVFSTKIIPQLIKQLFVVATLSALSVSAQTFKIGMTTDMSSAYSDLTGKGSAVAVQMAIDDFGGSVLGKKIELLVADHQMKPSVGSAIITQWYDKDDVSVIVGLAGSSVALAAQAIAKERPNRTMLHTIPLSSDLNGKSCIANAIHWAPDSYSLAASVANNVTEKGGKNWFLMIQDTAAGPPAKVAALAGLTSAGGKLLGDVKVPFNAGDVSSFVLQAQASKAQVLGIGFGGTDLANIIKAGRQFGLQQSGVKIAALVFFATDLDSIGQESAQGITFVMPAYSDMNEPTKAWSQRFKKIFGKLPGWGHVADYEGTMHYLKAVAAAGTDDARKVVPLMRKTPVNSFALENGVIREDNQLVRPMYLTRVKAPQESKFPGDYFDIIGKINPDNAYAPPNPECPLVKK
jgi:branched-chain amino acid transport system substrate-binding protein